MIRSSGASMASPSVRANGRLGPSPRTHADGLSGPQASPRSSLGRIRLAENRCTHAGTILRRRHSHQFILFNRISSCYWSQRRISFRISTSYVPGAGSLALQRFIREAWRRLRLDRDACFAGVARHGAIHESACGTCFVSIRAQCGWSWFSLTKLAPWAKPDPFAIVRGTNA